MTAAYSAATPSRSNGVSAYTSSPTETSARSSAGRDHTGQLVRRNRRQPIERPLELVTRDGGGVYFDEYLARSKRWRLDRLEPKPVDTGGVQADCLHRSRNGHVGSILCIAR